MVMFLITSIGLLAGCGADYGYAFHFYVDGGNGEISIETTPSFFLVGCFVIHDQNGGIAEKDIRYICLPRKQVLMIHMKSG